MNVNEIKSKLEFLGWKFPKKRPSLLGWEIIEDKFDFHSKAGSVIRKLLGDKGDFLIIDLDPDAWFGEWSIAFIGESLDTGIVLASSGVPKQYLGENGMIINSLLDDILDITKEPEQTE